MHAGLSVPRTLVTNDPAAARQFFAETEGRTVAQAVARRGGHTIRFDTDRYPTEVRLSASYGGARAERLTLTNEEGAFDLGEVTAVWHRRLNFGAHLPATLDRQLRHASLGRGVVAVFIDFASPKANDSACVRTFCRADELRYVAICLGRG